MLHALAHWLGLNDGSGPQYLWWSGIFSDASIFGGALLVLRHVNCHQSRCWRIGRHPVGPYKVCAHHHPAIDGKVTQAHIEAAHAAAQAR